MKKSRLLVSSMLALASLTTLRAQTPAPKPEGEHPLHEKRGPGGNFDPQQREKFKAAHEKALQDPAVQAAQEKVKQAQKDLRDVARPKMLAADPSLGPILDKVDAAEKEKPATPPDGADRKGSAGPRGGGLGGEMRGLAALTPEEREKVKAAHEKIKDDPEVKAAQEKLATAAQEFRKALHDAMLAADPTLGPALEKMQQMHPGGGRKSPDEKAPADKSSAPQS